MLSPEDLVGMIRSALPDAVVEVKEQGAGKGRFKLLVESAAFEGSSLVDRHRMVFRALNDPIRLGTIHSLEIKTGLPVKEAP